MPDLQSDGGQKLDLPLNASCSSALLFKYGIFWLQQLKDGDALEANNTKPTGDLPLVCNLGYINEWIHLEMNQFKETPQHPSLEVYFWYHHQNFYKTFSDNNILKEEPCFCAWTRSPQKCFRSEYSKKNQKSKQVKEKKRKINNKPATKENNAAHIYNLQKWNSLCREDGWGGDSRVPLDLHEELLKNAAIGLEPANKG